MDPPKGKKQNSQQTKTTVWRPDLYMTQVLELLGRKLKILMINILSAPKYKINSMKKRWVIQAKKYQP